jgi:hypothetical protein
MGSMNRRNLVSHGLALGLAAAALAGARPAVAVDVLDGLAPADFHSATLAQAEARALAPQPRAGFARSPDPGANPLGTSQGATTLADLGVGSGATELRVSGDSERQILAQTSAEDRRLLGTLAVLGVLDGATGDGGILDVDDLLDDLDDVLDDLPGGLGGILGDGGVVDIDLDSGGNVTIDLLDGDGNAIDVPEADLQDILDELPIDLPIRLPILLQ